MGIRSLKTASISTGAKRSKFWDQVATPDAYVHISTVTVGAGGQPTIDFGTIPTGYKHLEIRGVVRTDSGNSSDALILKLNGSKSVYTHYLYGNGAPSAGGVGSSTTVGNTINVAGGGRTSGVFSGVWIMVQDHESSNKYKTSMSFGGYYQVGTGGEQAIFDNTFSTTSPITTVSLYVQSTASATTYNFAQNSSLSLFGIKGQQ